MPDGVQGADPHLRRAREALPRHAGHRIHRRAGQALDAADAQRQAHREGRAAHRGRAGQREADHQGRGGGARSIRPRSISCCIRPSIPSAERKVIATGLPASPGAASGEIVFSSDEARSSRPRARRSSWCGSRPRPEDIHGMHAAEGILTTRGGMTSHAAVVARGMGKPCVSGAGSLRVDYAAQTLAGRRRDAQARRHHHHRRLDRPGAGRPGADDRAGTVRRVRHADGLGRQGAQARRARQCRHAGRRARRASSSAPRASGSAAPSTCSSTRIASTRCAR